MGCLQSQYDEDSYNKKKSLDIDHMLKIEAINGSRVIKVLILGAGESGKSTFVKQMKIINMKGYTKQELLDHKSSIYRNLLENAKQIVVAMDMLGAELSDEKLKEYVKYVRGYSPESFSKSLSKEFYEAFKYMWIEAGVKALYEDLSGAAYMIESAPYFFDSIDRISGSNYVPTEMDIIKSRVKTTGICEIRFNLSKDREIHMYDVGGQRSERKKWIHCFEKVTSVLFITALSEYNQTLLEDSKQNRLVESLVLFNSIVNSQWFSRSSIILFLNKMDVFKEKLKKVPLKSYIEDYNGANEFQPAAAFIRKKFLKLNKANLHIYDHYTCCTDTEQMKFVYEALRITLISNSLSSSGLVDVG